VVAAGAITELAVTETGSDGRQDHSQALPDGQRTGTWPAEYLEYFASVDWVMSLEPKWTSTIFGLILVASWSLSALAFTIVVMSWLRQRDPMNRVAQTPHFHDWGNLMMALVMLWMLLRVLAVPDHLVRKSAGRDRLYVARTHDGWGIIAIAIVILQFAFPFYDAAVTCGEEEFGKTRVAGGY